MDSLMLMQSSFFGKGFFSPKNKLKNSVVFGSTMHSVPEEPLLTKETLQIRNLGKDSLRTEDL